MAGALPKNNGNKTANRIGATVSRRLRSAGIRVSPAADRYRREGTFVAARGDLVSVLVSTGDRASNTATAARVLCAASHWPQVHDFEIEKTEDGSCFVWFTYGR